MRFLDLGSSRIFADHPSFPAASLVLETTPVTPPLQCQGAKTWSVTRIRRNIMHDQPRPFLIGHNLLFPLGLVGRPPGTCCRTPYKRGSLLVPEPPNLARSSPENPASGALIYPRYSKSSGCLRLNFDFYQCLRWKSYSRRLGLDFHLSSCTISSLYGVCIQTWNHHVVCGDTPSTSDPFVISQSLMGQFLLALT